MKKLIYTAFVICGMLTASCSDLLNLESKTDVTNNYLFTTPEGLNTAVTGLYSLARELPGGADNNESNLYIVTMCDFNTDIAILRAGVSTSIGRLNTSFTPSTGDVNKFWKHHYGIIGKANEIIVAAEALGLDDSDVLHAWSEAKFFRGRSYFELWKRFDRLYLNITPTTVDNLKREYKPASHEELMTLITTDLDDAMKGLDWSLPQNNGNVIQNLILENREKLTITGVVDVLSFDDQVVIVETELGLLTVKGENLRINKLSIDTSEVIIEGDISYLAYSDKELEKNKGSILNKIFK